jgi:hypothetical protein
MTLHPAAAAALLSFLLSQPVLAQPAMVQAGPAAPDSLAAGRPGGRSAMWSAILLSM